MQYRKALFLSDGWIGSKVSIQDWNKSVLAGELMTIIDADMILVEWNTIRSPWFLIQNIEHRKKIWFWGIGMSSSNGLRVDIRDLFLKRAMVFGAQGAFVYSELALPLFRMKNSKQKVKVLTNTKPFIRYGPIENLDEVIIGFIGSLNERKGLDEFIDLVEKVSDMRPIRCELIGDGPYRDCIEERLKRINVKIELLGQISEVKIISQIMSRWSVMLSPGQVGLSCVDALVNGVPVVARRSHITGGESSLLLESFSSFLYSSYEEGLNCIDNAIGISFHQRQQIAEIYSSIYDNNTFINTIKDTYENSLRCR